MNQIKLSLVDLFAGCGGLSLGLEQAGFTPVYVNELNSDARHTYISNRIPRHPWFAEALKPDVEIGRFFSSDIRELSRNDTRLRKLESTLKSEFGIWKGDLDLVVGGPPCQGFSGIGHRRSYSVDKAALPSNHLFQDMVAVVKWLRPKAFIFENVRGLLTSRWTSSGEKGQAWQDIKKAFLEIGGYAIGAQLVHAKEYDVAQNRPRVLLVGIREDIYGESTSHNDLDGVDDSAIDMGLLPAPIGSKHAPNLVELLGDLVDPEYENGGCTEVYPKPATTAVQKSMRSGKGGKLLLHAGDPVSEHQYSKHSEALVKKFQAMLERRSFEKTKKFSQRVLPAKWGRNGPNITATSLPDDYIHFSQPRTLTVREWARLQGFPDWYEFHGKRTTGGLRRAGNPQAGQFVRELPKYTQIGNAVPVPLARAVGKHLAKRLQGGHAGPV
jgi:DNA (cytosine-5)-methyltransferase 1